MVKYTVCHLVICAVTAIYASDLYKVDITNGSGRRFDGIGGLSGGGATSKLLVNYPKEQRDQILDYLFKPGFGASLHILKVEIGGDAQSTDGSESSHMHNSWDENYQRGYEWWLMTEAKKRNPDILLYCLPWAFPAWVGAGTRNPYHKPELTASYVIKYILGAKKHYNLTMNYVGIWNERRYNAEYIKVLRQQLDKSGLKDVQIVAADGLWEPISLDIQNDKALADAVDFIGVHYPGTKGSAIADETGKQLWSSEDYSTFNDNVGAGCWARILNQNFVNGNMTSTISWNLIASYYEDLPFKRNGLMTADSPWTGYYTVNSPIWVTAHTTQFAWPGWTYLPQGSGSGLLKGGGSMVALQSPDSTQLTMVIETMSRNHSICVRPYLPEYDVVPQNITIQLNGHFATLFKVDVWYSKLGFNDEETTMMKHLGAFPVMQGQIHLNLGVDEIFTVTTLETGSKGNYPSIPANKPFPLPYMDDFESYKSYQEPFNLAQQTGVYEIRPSAGVHGNVAHQVITEIPCYWCKAELVNSSLNIIGNFSWTDIYVQVDTHIGTVNATSGVFVAARVDKGGCSTFGANGIFFFLFPAKGQLEVTGDLARTRMILQKSVSVSSDWNTLSLLVKDGYAIGGLNGEQVFNVSTSSVRPDNGFVGLGTAEYGLADFDNLKIMESKDGERMMRTLQKGGGGDHSGSSPYSKSQHISDSASHLQGNAADTDDTLYFHPSSKRGKYEN